MPLDAATRPCALAALAPALALLAVAGTALAQTPGVGTPTTGPAPRFTVIGLPDTQNYSQFYPEIFRAQTEWVVANRGRRNIQFVSHYGDVVNNGDRLNEWANAKAAMSVLDRADVPYGVVAGNHDVTPSGSAGSPYIPQYFRDNYGPANFAGRRWSLGSSPSGMSNAQVFTGGGRQFLALHIEVDTPLRELSWAQALIDQHRDKPVMLTTHRYLQDAEDYTGGVPVVPSGRYPDIWYGFEGLYTPDGIRSNEFFDWFVRTNKNIFMVNCGHFHEEYRQTSKNLWNNDVHEVLADYQDDPNGGDGWLRIMEFDTARNRIDVESYSPTLNQFRSADESRFSLAVQFDRYASGPQRKTVGFQEGVNGYAGTKDTWLNQDQPGRAYGNDTTFQVDDDTTNSPFVDRRGQGLLRFDDIITTDGADNTVPRNATITEATLRLRLEDDIDFPFASPRIFVYLMLQPWDESSTWNSLVNGLTQGSDYGQLIGSFNGDNNPNDDFWRLLDVTAAVQAWANGAPNYGFALIPEIVTGNDDGVTLWASEAGNFLFRPRLDVTYVTGLIPTPGAAALLALAGVLASRRRR